jgi:opacity protein-like surface antigen
LGLGVARNRLGRAAYALPGLGADAATVVPAATRTGAAWMAAAGVSWPLSARTTLDLAYRYADLGEVRTGAGRAVVTRPGAARTLDLAPTRAALVTQGVSASLRWAF